MPGAIPIMASFKPFPDEFQKPWVIGVIADRDEFVREIKQTTLRVLLAASVVACLAVVTISLLSKRLTGSLRQVVEETERIQDFRAEGIDAFQNPDDLIEGAVALEADEHADRVFEMLNSTCDGGVIQEVRGSGGLARSSARLHDHVSCTVENEDTPPPADLFLVEIDRQMAKLT